jgi:hypothetical protein
VNWFTLRVKISAAETNPRVGVPWTGRGGRSRCDTRRDNATSENFNISPKRVMPRRGSDP